MKRNIKSLILLLAATAIGSVAGAQNTTTMEDKKSVADTVKNGFEKIGNGVVSGYKTIENGVVEGFTRISDAFVKKFLMRDGETLEEAKARIAREEELHRQNQERVAASRQYNASN